MVSSGRNGQRTGCLEPEVLAAYVERGLSLAERAHVESHLASCPHCVAVVAGVVRTAEALAPRMPDAGSVAGATPRVGRRTLVGMLAAAAAVIAVLFVPSMLRPRLDRDAGLVSLVGTGNERTVLGRLTGGLPHAPLGEPSAGGQDGRAADTVRLVQAADKIRESFGERQTPSRLHALGLSQLGLRRYDDAAWSLLAASREQPDNAQYLSDVSAVQLERARLGLRPDDLPRALASADRARRLDPSLTEAWFNRALATTALSLPDQARQAWADYLARDGASPWAAEARAQLATLSQPTPAALWPGIETRLRIGVDASLAEEAVRVQTTEARHFIEIQLLPAWAEAVANGGSGALERDRMRTMADAFQRIAGDALYADTVHAIDRAESSGREALLRLGRAHQQYAEGAAHFEANRFKDAVPELTAAADALRAEGSPFAIRANLDLASIAYVGGQSTDAQRLLSDALATARASGYSYVAVRSTRFLGMLAMGQGRIGDAEALYGDMLAAAEGMGDAEQAAMAHGLFVSLYFYLGDSVSAWRHLPQAATVMSTALSPAVRYLQMTIAATVLGTDNPEVALSLQNAVITNAKDWGRDAAVAEALTKRSAILLALGRGLDAEADAAGARARLDGLDPIVRGRVEMLVLSAESDLLRASSPRLAADAAARAIAIVKARKDRLQLARLNLKLAKANIVSGRLDDAEAALTQGIEAFEAERASLSDEGRISTSDESWQLFRTGVELALRRKDYPHAFAMAERARATTLAEARRLPANASLKEVQAALSPDQAVIALNQFDDELAIWLIRPDRTDVVMRPVSRADAARLAERQRDEIRIEARTPGAGAALFDQILRPFAGKLGGVSRIVFVPDAPYQDVSFAAFWDSSTRRFLVQNVSLSVAPSVSSLAGRRAARGVASTQAPLVVGGADESTNASARAVAAVYQSAELLTGASATARQFIADAGNRAVVQISAPMVDNAAYPLLSRVLFADESGRPHSGAVLGRDIAAQSFANTNLVVLAEPDTNDREGNAGAMGMTRAFLTAGVPAVVGMLPGLDETSARDVLVGFHRQLAAGASAEQALTTYQRNVLQSNGGRLGAWSALVLYGSDR